MRSAVVSVLKMLFFILLLTGAMVPSWLALLPPNIKEPKGDYVWPNNQIVDWVNGPAPPLDY